MNTILTDGSELFKWVLQTSWQAAVLACLILLGQRIFRRQISAAWRYGLWFLLLARLVMPFTPQSAFSVFNLAWVKPASPPLELTPTHDTSSHRPEVVNKAASAPELIPVAAVPIPDAPNFAPSG